ncbi:MAG: PfkB family carbohydrate kinase, partial [Patescibacteria group bacterium]
TGDTSPEAMMITLGDANQSLLPDEVLPKIEEHIKFVDYLYLGGSFKMTKLLPYYSQYIQIAKSNGVKVVLDHGRVTNQTLQEDVEIVKKTISDIDIYLPNYEELLSVWKCENLEDAVKKVREESRCTIVVKKGVDGAYGNDAVEEVSVPGFKVPVVHTVGAGDSFNSGFIRAQSMGMGFKDSIKFANATAAIKISKYELPTVQSIEELLKTQ